MDKKISVSYKMSIDEACSQIHKYYNEIMQIFVLSGIYAAKKQQTIKKLIRTFIIITLCLSPWIYKGIVSGVNADEMVIFIFSLVCILLPIIFLIYLFAYFIIDKDFSTLIKSDCLNHLLETLLNLNIANKSEAITNEEINQSGLFKKWNTRYTEDAFIAESDNIKYKISETDLKQKTGSGKNSTITTVFKGLLISVENRKNIDSSIEIATKTKESIEEDTRDYTKICFIWYSIPISIIIGLLSVSLYQILLNVPFFEDFVENLFTSVWQTYKIHLISIFAIIVLILSKIYRDWDVKRLQNQQLLRLSKKVKTGNTSIDEDFDIILSDSISDSYKIVNQDLTQFLLNIKTLFQASKVQLKFYDKSIMLAISTNKDLFELGNLRNSPLDKRISGDFVSQLAGILMFMDYIEQYN